LRIPRTGRIILVSLELARKFAGLQHFAELARQSRLNTYFGEPDKGAGAFWPWLLRRVQSAVNPDGAAAVQCV
jgi:hypothetical protein